MLTLYWCTHAPQSATLAAVAPLTWRPSQSQTVPSARGRRSAIQAASTSLETQVVATLSSLARGCAFVSLITKRHYLFLGNSASLTSSPASTNCTIKALGSAFSRDLLAVPLPDCGALYLPGGSLCNTTGCFASVPSAPLLPSNNTYRPTSATVIGSKAYVAYSQDVFVCTCYSCQAVPGGLSTARTNCAAASDGQFALFAGGQDAFGEELTDVDVRPFVPLHAKLCQKRAISEKHILSMQRNTCMDTCTHTHTHKHTHTHTHTHNNSHILTRDTHAMIALTLIRSGAAYMQSI